MSEHITHIAVYEDSCTIVELAHDFPQAFKNSLKKYPDCGLMCSASRGNHLYALPILNRVKQKKSPSETDLKQLAGALGWLTHRAADLTVKPLFRITDKESKETGIPDDIHQIYHDAFTFKYVYEDGKRKSLSPYVNFSGATLETGLHSHPSSQMINASQTEFLLTGLVHSDVLGLHKFTNDPSQNTEAWLNTFFERRQRLYEDLRMYIEARQNPDPALVKKFITDANYYNDQDELIRLVRSVQKGKVDKGIELKMAVEKAAKQSIYAQALARSYQFLNGASRFYKNDLSASETYDMLDIMPKEHRLVH
jgi:hypothetical protein